MKRAQFWIADWFVGLLVALLFLFGANGDLMQCLERKAYDLGVRAPSQTPGDTSLFFGPQVDLGSPYIKPDLLPRGGDYQQGAGQAVGRLLSDRERDGGCNTPVCGRLGD
jgi:hypothetical protein